MASNRMTFSMRMKAYRDGRDAGVLTANDCRTLEDMEPSEQDGADENYGEHPRKHDSAYSFRKRRVFAFQRTRFYESIEHDHVPPVIW